MSTCKICPPAKYENVVKMLEVLTRKDVRHVLTKYLNIDFISEVDHTSYYYKEVHTNILDY